MSLNSAIESALPFLRAEAESRMTDQCLITTPSPPDAEPVWNPTTGQYETPPPTEVYGPNVAPHFGKCTMPNRGASAAISSAGPESWNVGEFPFSIPVAPETEAVAAGMTVEWLASKFNPSLVGRVFVIAEPLFSSQPTSLRFKIKTNVG